MNKQRVVNVIKYVFLLTLLAAVLLCAGCSKANDSGDDGTVDTDAVSTVQQEDLQETDSDIDDEKPSNKNDLLYDKSDFLKNVPEWAGFAFCYINDNVPDFEEDEIWTSTQESLDPLDDLGRCGSANSCIGQDGMPTEPRGDISSVEPTGWHTEKYDFVEGEMLFNRCHLIGHQLSGDDAVPRNLITGTSYLNRDGMLPFENAIAAYVKETGNHVMYRVTPVFKGQELISRGVHMEAVSVEDDGAGISFNIFCYNVQPGIDINYDNGDNKLSDDSSMLEQYQSGKFAMIPNFNGIVNVGNSSGEQSDGAGSDVQKAGEGKNDSGNNAQERNNPEGNNPEKSDSAKNDSANKGQANSDKNQENQNNQQDNKERTYVLNTNTGRFHYPDCKSVKDIADHNKQVVEATRDDLINRGFKSCGNCKP